MSDRILLAVDIGGTKSDIIAFSEKNGPGSPLAASTFASADYRGLEELATAFLVTVPFAVDAACFGVAGPVVGNRSAITNLPWIIDGQALERELALSRILLINDLAATAAAIPYLLPDDLKTIKHGTAEYGGRIGVLAPGTGLGEAFSVWDGSRYLPCSSEGGHTDFAPTSAEEIELLRYMQKKIGHVSYEHLVSGSGLPNIFAFLRESGSAPLNPGLKQQLATAADQAPVIVANGLTAELGCPLCRKTLEMFVAILAAEAGNLALKVMATGGIFLGGGIPLRILAMLDTDAFRAAFTRKGRMTRLLSDIPVHVILNPKAALLGAAYTLLEKGVDG